MNKSIFVLLLLFLTNMCFGQINLEHTYASGYATRVVLENSGEKYYVLDIANKQVRLYHADHTSWKTINLPTPAGATVTAIYHLSESKINPDAQIEVTYSYYVLDGGVTVYQSRVSNESGTTLLTIPGASSVFLNQLPGLEDKLIAFIQGTPLSSKVYSLPSLSLEHSYNNGQVSRTNLENSGEKYYLLHQANKEAQLFNANHTPWKTIGLPTTTGATIAAIYHLSESKINPDPQIEVIYSYHLNNGGVLEYESRVLNESGTTLLTIPGASSVFFNELPGLADKLIAFMQGTPLSSKVYSLPSLSLEHSYNSGYVYRANLENSGEKYYVLDQVSKEAQLFNANHTPWKTISLPSPTGATLTAIYHLSESIIDPDPQIELVYSYYSTNGGNADFESRILDESGTTLLTIPGAMSVYLSELPALNNKLMALIYGPPTSSKVYGLPTMGVTGFDEKSITQSVLVFPNPTSHFITVSTDHAVKPDAISIYNLSGKKVHAIADFDNKPIDVSTLNKGGYLVVGLRGSRVLFQTKFIVD